MNYCQFSFNTNSVSECEILIAQLGEIGFEGFEEDGTLLKAFIKEQEINKNAVDDIAKNANIDYTVLIIEQQNWNAAWESSFEPVTVNDFAAVRASFHAPVKNVLHDIIITPKMSFGTGHHATTYLMIEQMSRINFNNKAVLDFGTGTGVLAILANKMGASFVTAIDNDDWSIENAHENIGANNCSAINIKKAEAISPEKKYEIILANINLNVIVQNMEAIKSCCLPGTIILLSGFLYSDEDLLKQCLLKNSIKFISSTRKADWICVTAIAETD